MAEPIELEGRDARIGQYIRDMGEQNRCVRIDYTRYDGDSSVRVVEPYQFLHHNGNLMVCCWQVDPDNGGDNWRNFRIDRMNGVDDGGSHYTPRRSVQLRTASEFGMDVEPTGSLVTVNNYYQHIWNAMADGKLVNNEKEFAASVATGLSPNQVRAVHAQIFRDVLQECLLDGEIDWRESEHLAKVRRFLKKLGWAPGDKENL